MLWRLVMKVHVLLLCAHKFKYCLCYTHCNHIFLFQRSPTMGLACTWTYQVWEWFIANQHDILQYPWMLREWRRNLSKDNSCNCSGLDNLFLLLSFALPYYLGYCFSDIVDAAQSMVCTRHQDWAPYLPSWFSHVSIFFDFAVFLLWWNDLGLGHFHNLMC